MIEQPVGVLGARSLVGESVLTALNNDGLLATAFSRSLKPAKKHGIDWCPIDTIAEQKYVPSWVCLLPLWILTEYLDELHLCGAKRIVALSSTSRFTKAGSNNAAEAAMVERIIEAETKLIYWSAINNIDCTILRPTLIYGNGLDRNISEIVRLINRFHFFPVVGGAKGRRQPVHADDVARVCLNALDKNKIGIRCYNLSGGEVLTYREMVRRIFLAMQMKPYVFSVPISFYHLMLSILKRFPPYKHWNAAMGERMNQDMVFDHSDATRDLAFRPRSFKLNQNDLPRLE